MISRKAKRKEESLIAVRCVRFFKSILVDCDGKEEFFSDKERKKLLDHSHSGFLFKISIVLVSLYDGPL